MAKEEKTAGERVYALVGSFMIKGRVYQGVFDPKRQRDYFDIDETWDEAAKAFIYRRRA